MERHLKYSKYKRKQAVLWNTIFVKDPQYLLQSGNDEEGGGDK